LVLHVDSDVDQFRELVRECSARDDRLLVVSYDRRYPNLTTSKIDHVPPLPAFIDGDDDGDGAPLLIG
jgi:hypothetical protein